MSTSANMLRNVSVQPKLHVQPFHTASSNCMEVGELWKALDNFQVMFL